jgi:hypothetical protein
VGPDPERAHERRGAVLESDDRRVVEMVVVVVGDEDGIERRQVTDGEQRRKETLGADEVDRPDPFAPHRVGEEAMPIDLEQDRRMAQPRDADSRDGRRRETARFYGNRARRKRGLHVGAARELVPDGRPDVVHDRLRVLEVRALPLGRLLHPREPDTGRSGPERGAARNRACSDQRREGRRDQPPELPSRWSSLVHGPEEVAPDAIMARMSRFSKTGASRCGVPCTAASTMTRARSSARTTWLGNKTRNAG